MEFKDIDGITFDLFNTLIGSNGIRRDYKEISEYFISNNLEIYPQELEAARQYVFFHDLMVYGINSWDKWARQILFRLDIEYDDSILPGFIEKLGANSNKLFLFDDVKEIIDKLSEKYILSIVTTIPEFQFDDIIRPIADKFKIIVTGRNAKCAKGNKKMYLYDLDKKGVEASKNLFIGDDPLYDIHYPKRLGMKTIEIARNGKFQSEEADRQIRTLLELNELLL